eukprot:3725343-Lingulodinium_polyedra.AAC.1
MALEFADSGASPPGPTTLVGDNLGVVRYCASTGRSRDPTLHGVLDGPLTHAACRSQAAPLAGSAAAFYRRGGCERHRGLPPGRTARSRWALGGL